MKWYHFGALPLFAPNDGGGGGGGDGEPVFVALNEGAEATADQGKQASDYLGKTEGFDPKSVEGKSHTELWQMAHAHESKARLAADPFKGTEWQGLKVPAKFVVEKDGKKSVNTADLVKSYAEMERGHFRRRDELKAEVAAERQAELEKLRPATAGDYKPGKVVKFSDGKGGERDGFGVTIGERTIEILPEDPAMQFMKATAYKLGVPQEEFEKIVEGYVAASLSAGPKWSDESKKLGGETIALKREARVNSWMKGNLSADNYAWFAAMPSTQRSIEAIEQLMTLSGHPPFVPEEGDIPGETYTRAQLQKMQSDPRYTGEGGKGDKAYQQLVRNGFKRLAAAGR